MAASPPARRKPAQMDHDAKAVDLRRRHLTYAQIGEQLGVSVTAAYNAVRRGMLDVRREPADYVRNMELERYDEWARVAIKVLYTPHYVVSTSGKVVCDPVTGKPLVDDAPRLHALDRLVKLSKAKRELLGLDAPSRLEVTRVDGLDADIARLMAELASGGEGPAPGHPEVRDVAQQSEAGTAPPVG